MIKKIGTAILALISIIKSAKKEIGGTNMLKSKPKCLRSCVREVTRQSLESG